MLPLLSSPSRLLSGDWAGKINRSGLMRKSIERKLIFLYKLKHDAIAKRKGKPQEATQSEQQEHEEHELSLIHI